MKTFSIIYIIFIISSSLHRLLGKASVSKEKRTKGEVHLRWLYSFLYILYLTLLIGSITEYFLIDREINLYVSGLSLLIYISAIMIRKWSIKSLGNFWSVHIEIKENHRIIKKGPYRYLRHPNSLCIILESLSLPLIPNAYYTFLFALFVYVPILIVRMYLEDTALVKKFGQEYIQYRKEVWALFPLPIGKKGVKL